MSSARLTVQWPGQPAHDKRIPGTVAIGSAETNFVRIPRADVSRHHALIARRSDEYWLVNLGGHDTRLNGEPVNSDRLLCDGDLISIGDDASILFRRDGVTPATHPPDREAPPRRLPPWFYAAGAAAIVAVLVVALVRRQDPGCGLAQIVSPAPGTRTSESLTIRVSVEKPACVERIVYRVGETEAARTDGSKSEVRIDPQRLGLPTPGIYPVSATVESKDGRTQTTEAVPLTLLAREVRAPEPTAVEPSRATSRERLRELAKRLAAEIKRPADYVFEDEFLDEIGRHIADFRGEAAARAAARRSTAEQAFNNQGMSPALGVSMAASLGLSDDVSINKLAEKVRDVRLQFIHGEEDFMYVAACYGMKLREVARVAVELRKYDAASRRNNFWLMRQQLRNYLPRDAGERVARLFAAGIVATNPQEFD